MSLPKFTYSKIPEGRYKFIVAESPVKRRQESRSGEDFIKVIFVFKVEMPDGRFRKHTEHIVPWDMKYGDLLLALGGIRDESNEIHLGDVDEDDLVGKEFWAEIAHEPDRKDPTKTYAKIASIEVPGEGEVEEVTEPTGKSFDDEPPDDVGEEEADIPPPNNKETEDSGEPLPEDDGKPDDEEAPF